MFVDDPALDDLRQGDVLSELYFPQWNVNQFQLVSPPDVSGPKSVILPLQNQGTAMRGLLCSHDCEVDNMRSRAGLMIAPIFEWPFADVGSEESLTLISSRSINPDMTFDYIHWFPLKFNVDGIVEWRLADLSAMVPISPPKALRKVLLAKKLHQMTDEARDQLKLKVAMFFGR